MDEAVPHLPGGEPAAEETLLAGSFAALVGKCQQRCRRVARWRLAAEAFLAGLSFLHLLLIAGQLAVVWPRLEWLSSLLAGGIALAAGGVYAWLRHGQAISPQAVLLELDRRLGTRERFITTWETLHGAPCPADIAALLLRQGAERLAHVQPRVMWPVTFSAHAKLLPVLLLSAALLLAVELPLPSFLLGVDPQLSQSGEELRSFARTLAQKADEQQLPLVGKVAERLAAEGKRLQTRSMSGEQARRRLEALRQELDRWQAAARSELPERGAELGQAASLLRQRQDLQEQLRELLRRAQRSDLPSPEAAAVQRHLRLVRDLLEAQLTARAQRLVERGLGRIMGAGEEGEEGAPRRSGGEPEGPAGRQAARDRDEEGGGQAASGIGADSPPARSATPQDLSPRSSVLFETPAQVAAGKLRSTMIRALPAHNAAQRPPQEVLSEYQRQLESLITREGLPREYRPFIRDYFLAIGLSQPQDDAPASGAEPTQPSLPPPPQEPRR